VEKDMKSQLWTKEARNRCSLLGGSDTRRRASEKSSGSPASAAHAEFVAALSGLPPKPIPLDADAIDLEDRADHLGQVFSALSTYVAVILNDTAQNVPGGLDLRDAEGPIADLAADLTGAIQRAADSMAGWLA
jgi:hypothetical protein